MSEDQLASLLSKREAILRQQRDLNDQLRELTDREQELRLEAELNKPVTIKATGFDESKEEVLFSVSYTRHDLKELLKNSKSVWFDSYANRYHIPADNWDVFVKYIREKLKNITFSTSLDTANKIKKATSSPLYQVNSNGKEIKVKVHPTKSSSNVFREIAGASWDYTKSTWAIPLPEITELLTKLPPNDRCVWEKDLLSKAREELDRRIKLDEIAKKKSSSLESPFSEGQELMEFQKIGVEFIQTANGRVLLADQMGLGKTWQVLAYAEIHQLRTLVICPAHLKRNWAREINSLTHEIPLILNGATPNEYQMKDIMVTKHRYTIINYDILGRKITVPEQVKTDENGVKHVIKEHPRWLWSELLSLAKFDLVVVDEAHYIKNSEAARSKAVRVIQSPHTVHMTGTPILNRPRELWTILNHIDPSLFPSEDGFVARYTYNGKQPRNVEELRRLLRPLMIRRLKADVVADLPPINRIVQIHELSDEGSAAYTKVLEGVYRAIDAAGNEIEKNITSILVEIGKLKEVCSLDKVDHVSDLAQELYDTEADAEKNGKNKVLIFSQYKETVRQIASRLGRDALSWTGDTAADRRNEMEKQFQNDPNVKYLVVSLMTAQTGLNLTAAGHVIFADLYWTPAAHAQAEERAYGRLSDLHGADSYYITAEGTIEEWIQKMLKQKLAVINKVVEGIDAERDVSIGMEIIKMLKEGMRR